MYINGKKLNVKRFQSGELKLLNSQLNSFVENNKVKILFVGKKFSLFELFIIIDYYNNKNVLIDLILAYLPYQRMDHKGTDEVQTLANVANLFNKFELESLTICEPHCSVENFNNAKMIGYVEGFKQKVFDEIGFNEQTDTVLLTDKGGFRRYANISKNVVYFEKERDKQTGLIVKHNIVGKLNNTGKIVIVDDIISTGDTIVNIINYVEKLGAKEVYVFCGHLENNACNKRILQSEIVVKVFATNSLCNTKHKKLKLFDVKELFYDKTNNKKGCKLD